MGGTGVTSNIATIEPRLRRTLVQLGQYWAVGWQLSAIYFQPQPSECRLPVIPPKGNFEELLGSKGDESY